MVIKKIQALSLSVIGSFVCLNSVQADMLDNAAEIAKSQFYFDVNAGVWLVNWDQVSTASSKFGSDAISTDYAIEMAPAAALSAKIGFTEFFTSKFEYVETQDDTGKKLSKYAGALGFFINDFTFYSQLYQGKFHGSLSGIKTTAGTSEFGSGTFETNLNLTDFVIFYKNIGLGYRDFKYELPQDLYLVSAANPSSVIASGFEEIKYSGNFAMVAYDSNLGNALEAGWNLALYAGMGDLKPSGKFLEDLNANATISAANEGKSIMNNGQAYFIEGNLAYQWVYKRIGIDWGINAGYKYSKLAATFDNNANYALVTDFETTLNGPFVELTGEF